MSRACMQGSIPIPWLGCDIRRREARETCSLCGMQLPPPFLARLIRRACVGSFFVIIPGGIWEALSTRTFRYGIEVPKAVVPLRTGQVVTANSERTGEHSTRDPNDPAPTSRYTLSSP